MKRVIIAFICLMTIINCFGKNNFTENVCTWFERVPMFSFGFGTTVEFNGDGNHIGYGGDIIAMGALVSLSFTRKPSLETGSCESEIIDKVTFHVGYTIPVKNFGDDKHINRLFVSPIVEFNCISHDTGHYLHEYTSDHHCQIWKHSGYATDEKTGYGAAVMYQRSVLYTMLKVTTKSASLTAGISF